MRKLAYQMGNLQAMHSLGLIPDESLQNLGLIPGGARAARPSPYSFNQPSQYLPPEEETDWGRKLRKIGPAAGATVGAVLGGLARKRLGGLGKGLFAGTAAGATAGWLPDIYATASEELSS